MAKFDDIDSGFEVSESYDIEGSLERAYEQNDEFFDKIYDGFYND